MRKCPRQRTKLIEERGEKQPKSKQKGRISLEKRGQAERN